MSQQCFTVVFTSGISYHSFLRIDSKQMTFALCARGNGGFESTQRHRFLHLMNFGHWVIVSFVLFPSKGLGHGKIKIRCKQYRFHEFSMRLLVCK